MNLAANLAVSCLLCIAGVSLANADSIIVSGDAFVPANADTFSINASAGDESRNRVGMPVNGLGANLHVVSNLSPAAGSIAHVCVRVNGVDTGLCVDYTSADWPGTKGNLVDTVHISRRDLVTLHYTELGGVSTGANIRSSFEIRTDGIFEHGFETPVPGTALNAAVVTGEPFMNANANAYSIGGSNGTIERNRAAAPRDGVAQRLTLIPDMAPAGGALVRACLTVNGVDTNLCVDYTAADWPLAKSNALDKIAVGQGDTISVHFRELNGQSAGANFRATFDLAGVAGSGAVLITDEPFLVANGDAFSISGSSGSEDRNSMGAPRNGTLRNLYLMPSQQPAAGSLIRACLRVNGLDTPLCVDYSNAQWPNSAGNTVGAVPLSVGDRVTVHFRELNGVSSGANVRASFTFD